ncbi:BON domain-containing protein [Paraburkholderia panacisoli]|uniref:BON domain-containing protein n=1 Tax=Paraburkholderia panacisoli TaxID=2603818 RepID=A0A5B0G2Q2_9BURK|nr:BON domain-containing protein [Paraburkholderia panacisoli]KAA0997777.1 BON domain-containing protein [Paraburkholderia panacisoli]
MSSQVISKALLIVLFPAVSASVWSQTSGNREVSADHVEAVSQKLIVKSDRLADRALRRRIYKALAKHTEVDAGNISIVAKNGQVTLDGTVRDAGQIDTVEKVTRSDPGVLAVTNKLAVQRPFEE